MRTRHGSSDSAGTEPSLSPNWDSDHEYKVSPGCHADVDLCPGSNCSPPYYFTWYPSEGVSDMHGEEVTICRPAVTTTYTVSIIDLGTNANGCCNSVQIVVNPVSTGSACAYIPPESNPCYGYTPHRTEEKENPVALKLLQTSLLNISPNPTDGRIKIQWDSKKMGNGDKVFRIFDLRGQLLGQIILASEEDTGELNLNLSSLPQGVYFVQLVGRKEKLVGKIFKQ